MKEELLIAIDEIIDNDSKILETHLHEVEIELRNALASVCSKFSYDTHNLQNIEKSDMGQEEILTKLIKMQGEVVQLRGMVMKQYATIMDINDKYYELRRICKDLQRS